MTPVPQVYEELGIRQVSLPVGYSEYQPVELFFNWLDDDLRRKAWKRGVAPEWSFRKFEGEIRESASRVTGKMVKGWYREAWRHMFPRKAFPIGIKD